MYRNFPFFFFRTQNGYEFSEEEEEEEGGIRYFYAECDEENNRRAVPNIIDGGEDGQFYGDEEAINHDNDKGPACKDDRDLAGCSVYGSLGSDSEDTQDYGALVDNHEEEEEEEEVVPERKAGPVLGYGTPGLIELNNKTGFVPRHHKTQYYGILPFLILNLNFMLQIEK